MEIAETIKKVIQEIIVPELDQIKAGEAEIKAVLQLTNKRLDDMNMHLVDQSRRIDELRVELKREIAENTTRIDELNRRIDRLYEVIVRREEHEKLEIRIMKLEQEVAEIKAKVAA